MKKYLFTIVVFLLLASAATAQVAINTNGSTAAPSSLLDVNSTTKGVLISRMTSAQRIAIQNPEKGLLVFDLDKETIYFFDGEKWKPMLVSAPDSGPLISRKVDGLYGYDAFGTAVDIYDNWAVVGAPGDSAKGVTGGTVYIFTKQNSHWQQYAKISAPSPTQGDRFGTAVALFNDLLVVGAPDREAGGQFQAGAAFVFKRINKTWTYIATLSASSPGAYDGFGKSVVTNGSSIAIGAPERNYNGKTNAGTVYIFGLINGSWSQKATILPAEPTDEGLFGQSVDLWKTSLLIGSPGGLGNKNAVPGFKTGTGHLYTNTDANGFTWTFTKIFMTGYAHEDMLFGYSVSIDSNYLAIGAPAYSGSPQQYWPYPRGEIFCWKYENGSWNYVSAMMSNDYSEVAEAGKTVAVWNGMLMFGAPQWRQGRGKVKIMPSLMTRQFVYDENPNENIAFGSSIAIHNGQYIISSPLSMGKVFFGTVD